MPLLLNQTATPSTPAAGKAELFLDSADKKIKMIDDAGVILSLNHEIASLNAPVATSGVGETLILAGAVPLNSVAVGDMFSIRCFGISSSTGTLIFRVKAGPNGTTGDTQSWISLTSAAQAANQRAGFQGLLVVRSIGAGGTIQCECLGFAQAALLPTVVAAVGTVAINTTAQWFIDITCTCSVGTWTCQEAVIAKI